jgi:hypothetical protein
MRAFSQARSLHRLDATIQFLAPAALENLISFQVLRDDELVSNIQSESGNSSSKQLYSVLREGAGVPQMPQMPQMTDEADEQTESDTGGISLEHENCQLKHLITLVESSVKVTF